MSASEPLVPSLDKDEVDELNALFDKFDDNGNGELDVGELTKLISNLGVIARDEDLKNLVDAIDDNLSGTIDCWELVNYIDKIMADDFTSEEIVEAFNLMDVDQGGEISLEELRDAMKDADVGITKTEMDYMFRKVDRNGDGNLSLSEFRSLLRRKATKPKEDKAAS
ncbi:uncharacterized protein LOC134811820 [Bolinopsis microptera]|uniref:uncharacterized protein LOC134811820 n=1 Tax=Bolinopsis microptera TaxID=2820187 RepID=UPI00307A1980